MSLMWPVQVAMVSRLKTDSGVTALVSGRIFDGLAPPNTPFPYIRVGSKTEVPNDVLGNDGWSDTITADIFSAYQGDAEALEILGAMHAALRTPLSPEGHLAARLKPEFSTTLVEEDGKVRHVPIRYRITTFEAA